VADDRLARFIEDYLVETATEHAGYGQLLDTGLTCLIRSGALGNDVSPDVLTRRQQYCLRNLQIKERQGQRLGARQ
jgi:hypothetical protein